MGSDVVVSLIRSKTQLLVRLNGVETSILQLVGFDLIDEANSSALLSQIENDPIFHLTYSSEGLLKLHPAIAPERANSVASKTLGVQSYWNVLFLKNIAMDKRGVLFLVEIVPERDGLIVTV